MANPEPRAKNPFPLVDGHGDPELHPNGEQQAIAVGERLKDEKIDAIYDIAAADGNRTIGSPPRHEHAGGSRPARSLLGEWEGGVLRTKAAAGDPIFLKMQAEERWDAIPGAESWEALNTRVTAALARIHQAHANQKVVAVVHGGVIGHILSHATGASPFAFNGADNGSISRIVLHQGGIKTRSFNDNIHVQSTLHTGSGQLT